MLASDPIKALQAVKNLYAGRFVWVPNAAIAQIVGAVRAQPPAMVAVDRLPECSSKCFGTSQCRFPATNLREDLQKWWEKAR